MTADDQHGGNRRSAKKKLTAGIGLGYERLDVGTYGLSILQQLPLFFRFTVLLGLSLNKIKDLRSLFPPPPFRTGLRIHQRNVFRIGSCLKNSLRLSRLERKRMKYFDIH